MTIGKLYEFNNGTVEGWTVISNSGASISNPGGSRSALNQTVFDPSPSPFQPIIFAGANYDASLFRQFSMKVSVEGAPSGSFGCIVRSYTDQFFAQNFALQNGVQVVRLLMDHTSGTVLSLELDIPFGSLNYNDFKDMVVKIFWIAVTDDPNFRGMIDVERLDDDYPQNQNGLVLANDDRALQMNQLPNYFIILPNLVYGFGTSASDLDGSVYFAEYGGSIYKVTKDSNGLISMFSKVEKVHQLSAGLFSLLALPESNVDSLIVGSQATNQVTRANNGSVLFSGPGVFPMQLAKDANNNVYVSWQGYNGGPGSIQKRDTINGTIIDVASNVNLPQGVGVSSNSNVVYFSTFTLTDPRADDQINGTPLTQYVGGLMMNGALYSSSNNTTSLIVGQNDDKFWRNRGLSVDKRDDSIFVIEESNSWDQGNSSRISKVSTTISNSIVVMNQGMDFPQFPSFNSFDKRLYLSLPRDQKGAAVDPSANFTNVSVVSNIQITRM